MGLSADHWPVVPCFALVLPPEDLNEMRGVTWRWGFGGLRLGFDSCAYHYEGRQSTRGWVFLSDRWRVVVFVGLLALDCVSFFPCRVWLSVLLSLLGQSHRGMGNVSPLLRVCRASFRGALWLRVVVLLRLPFCGAAVFAACFLAAAVLWSRVACARSAHVCGFLCNVIAICQVPILGPAQSGRLLDYSEGCQGHQAKRIQHPA